jgi:hypothetical protein
MIPSMPNCPDVVLRLIERFDHQLDQVRSPDYNETQLRIDFVNPMFHELGWDIDNQAGYAEQYREVVHEDRVRVAGANKAPDYSFRVGGSRKFFLEAKKPAVNIKEQWEPAYQLRRYAWSAKLPVSLLTDFEELAIYDCRIQPKQFDKASVARREYITYKQYPEKWEFLSGTFSKDAVLRGDFDRYCGTSRGRGAQEFDEAFLVEIEEWRKKLASNIALRNESLDERSVNFAVQRIIDRVIFLRICEDRGIEHVGQLRSLLNGEEVYPRLSKFFRDADDRYNSGLFYFRAEKGRDEPPDELTPGLDVDDATLKQIIRRLYYPDSPYEFTVVSADILGSVYERFLGKVITLTAGHRARIEEKPEVRKAGGVYYTPTYIVDYIVENTVGKLLEEKTPKEAAKLKILDPACGSGSFLIGAYQHLLDWHLKWYIANDPQKWYQGKNATLRPAAPTPDPHQAAPSPSGQSWRLTIKERKRILLDNIHGVDIDYQAVEVTKLSLLLKVLEGETVESLSGLYRLFHERALPDLGHNIQCGNSLIGTDIMTTEAWEQMSEDERRRVNPFDFERAFPQVFKQGGFDAVIGNPPYGAFATDHEAEYFRARFQTLANSLDSFIMFVEASARWLHHSGKFGMIIPSGWVSTPSSRPLREFFLDKFVSESFVSLPFDVFKGAYIDAVIATAERADGGNQRDSVDLIVFPHRYKIRGVEEFATFRKLTNARHWRESNQIEFLITCSQAELLLMEKLRENPVTIGDLVVIKRGIETYELHDRPSKLANPKHAFDGVLQRYLLKHGAARYLDYTPEIEQSKPWQFFSGTRVLLRQVLSRKLRLQATLVDEEFLTNQSVQSIIARPAALDAPDLRFLLACLNSKLMSWFFVNVNSAARRDDFPKIIIAQTKQLPLPFGQVTASVRKRHDRVVSLVDSIFGLQRRVNSPRPPHERERLERQIAATDREIDQLVYELYGLTDEEVRIVETVLPWSQVTTEVAREAGALGDEEQRITKMS